MSASDPHTLAPTAEHLKLLDRMYLRWEDCEEGAPAVDCKRPYGNSDAAGDIAEILGWEAGPDGQLSDEQEALASKLHRETLPVLRHLIEQAVAGAPAEGSGMSATEPTADAVLACPMNDPNDADASTIREYLAKLVHEVWVEKDCFSGKRPFGNSGWWGELEIALIAAGLVDGRFDEDGYIAEVDDAAVDKLIKSAIAAMGAQA